MKNFSIKRVIIATVGMIGLLLLLTIPYNKIRIAHNKEVRPYVNDIVNLRLAFGKNDNGFKNTKIFKIPFPSTKTLGVCIPAINTVIINSRTWSEHTEDEKYIVLFHEIAHCHLLKDHMDLEMADGCPVFIMNSYLPSTYCLNTHAKLYVYQIAMME